ncbi:hypothetical protein SPRG_03419 [Saprolegnia parasitica CBS 223.65]|uniref:TOG domain-containing protein n=1 Tax=Saprolegnia parasitica (strain CBS 223.65) TaxID=695850 RepID=A0A067CZK6_SAPPC|nr:hypothetical protein SPRG_03419 [Saprolegnia parasitica CBS 223.65]KDO32202.1 hypothetical protein SPRG_03419 [Saprolegnia parasitica CBS 223.65]|eukprot:XP_012197382.1 hypothetical protein SPRG_03419 [Saprolegnia parasitica CBS 223.65]
MDSVDTLVYQMEDDEPSVKLEAIRRLRELAATLQLRPAPFPVRNARRFLNCVRRRLHDAEPRIVAEALQFVCDLVPVIGAENLVHLYQIVLPPMLPMLPADPEWDDEAAFPHSALHVLWVYAQHTSSLQSVMDLLMNQGLNHEDGAVREGAIGALKALLQRNATTTLPGDVSWAMVLEVLIPAMEDDEERCVVAAEDAVAWLQAHVGQKQFQRLLQTLSSRDRAILAQHADYIQQFIGSSSPALGAASDDQLQFGLVPKWIVEALRNPSEAPPTAMDLLGRTLSPLSSGELLSVRSEWLHLFGFLAHLCAQLSSVRDRALTLLEGLCRTMGTYLAEVVSVLAPMLATVLAETAEPGARRELVHIVLSACPVAAFLKTLVPALQHGSCKVREAALHLWTIATLRQPRDAPIVRAAAFDLAAVLAHVCAVPIMQLLMANADAQADGLDTGQLQRRLVQRDVPFLEASGPRLLGRGDLENKTKLWLPDAKTPPPTVPPRQPKAEVSPQQSAEHIAKSLTVLKQRCLNKKRGTTPPDGLRPPERNQKAGTPVAHSPTEDRDQRAVRTVFDEDRPIKPMRATVFENDDAVAEAPLRARKPISLATAKRVHAKEASVLPPAAIVVEPEPETPAEGPTKPKVMTLATRKRLEAKQKQDDAALAPAPVSARSAKLKTGDDLKLALRAGKQEYVATAELDAYPLGKSDMAPCLGRLQSAEWENQFEGLTDLRRLCVHVPDVVASAGFSSVLKLVCTHIGNLRSAVAKNGMLAVETLCLYLGKRMDSDLDDVMPLLLKRAADTNVFLSESGAQTLDAVVRGCSAPRVLSAVLPHVASKNHIIRKQVGIMLGKLLSDGRLDVARDVDRVVMATCSLVNDSNNEVRDVAKPTLLELRHLGALDAARLRKLCPASCVARVEQVLSSAPALKDQVAKPLVRARSEVKDTTKYKPMAVADFDKIPTLNKQLESSNWKERFDALEEVQALVLKHAQGLCQSGKVLQVFDGLNKRLDDGNAKVNVFALETLQTIIPALGNGLDAVLSNLVPILTRSLAANNQKVAQLADGALDLLCAHVDAKLVVPHFVSVTKVGNARVKPGMLLKLDRLTQDAGLLTTQSAIHRHVLPLALDLIKESKTDVRDANYQLLRSLYKALGPSMLDSVYKLPKPHQAKLSQIIGVHITTA